MPVNIAAERDVPSASARRIADVFLRYKIADIILVAWAIVVLLIAAHATFGAKTEFLNAFDVSVAPL